MCQLPTYRRRSRITILAVVQLSSTRLRASIMDGLRMIVSLPGSGGRKGGAWVAWHGAGWSPPKSPHTSSTRAAAHRDITGRIKKYAAEPMMAAKVIPSLRPWHSHVGGQMGTKRIRSFVLRLFQRGVKCFPIKTRGSNANACARGSNSGGCGLNLNCLGLTLLNSTL
jgi:hypothetical protein